EIKNDAVVEGEEIQNEDTKERVEDEPMDCTMSSSTAAVITPGKTEKADDIAVELESEAKTTVDVSMESVSLFLQIYIEAEESRTWMCVRLRRCIIGFSDDINSKNSLRCSAERMWASLMHDAIKQNKGQVLVYLFTSCKRTLVKRYHFMQQCTVVEEVDLFADILHKIIDVLKNCERGIVFFDSIDIISLDSSFNRVIVLLKEISQYATVVARVHDECISIQNWERLSSIAHVTYSLEPRDMMIPLCTAVSYKADGKRTLKVGTINIDDSFCSFFKQYKAQDRNTSAERCSKLSTPECSFDIGLHLRKSEREAKERVSLPYESAQKEEELVRLRVKEDRKFRAGGRIIYTPDEADDFDESDPDDDLEI
ncbi:unnamed protein product, partial [Litomosoides sigmodontis]